MNFTIFIGGLSGGGAERVCCNIANYLDSKGHDVTMLTMADDTPSYKLNQNITRVSLLLNHERKGFVRNSITRYKRLFSYVHNTKSEVILVMLPATILSLLTLKHFTKAKIVASERNMPTLYSRFEQRLLKLFARFADGWVFQTKDQREWYGDAVNDNKAVVIPNAINPEFIRPPYTGARDMRIVTAGRLSTQKNHRLLIESFRKIADKYPDLILEIYGQGPLKEELETLVIDMNLNNRILFKGYCSDISDKIKNASAFVLSSDFEGIPNALMEAMAIGLPCVSTDTAGGGARLLIQNQENGLLVPVGDVSKLTEAICKLLDDRELSNRIGIAANAVTKRFSPESIYSKWEECLTNDWEK